MQTDPISDLLTRIRNAAKARHARVDILTSKLKVEVARILNRHLERRRRDVDAGDPRSRPFGGDGERDGTAARAQIQNGAGRTCG